MAFKRKYDLPFNGLFDYSNGDIKFTKEYIAWRGWKSSVSIDNIHACVLDVPNRLLGMAECPDDLKELVEDLGASYHSEAMNFWLDLNCNGRWDRVGKKKIEFELITDAVAYKLTWL